MKNLKHYILTLLLLSQLSVTSTIKADETVPAQNIEPVSYTHLRAHET